MSDELARKFLGVVLVLTILLWAFIFLVIGESR